MSQDSDHVDKLREIEEDDDSESRKVTELNPSNADVLQAIKEMDKRVTSKGASERGRGTHLWSGG